MYVYSFIGARELGEKGNWVRKGTGLERELGITNYRPKLVITLSHKLVGALTNITSPSLNIRYL